MIPAPEVMIAIAIGLVILCLAIVWSELTR